MTNIQFLHIRPRHLDGTFMTKGGTTYAFTQNDDGSFSVAEARCHWNDNFCRRIGRAISSGRLKAGKGVMHVPAHDGEVISQRAHILNYVEA